MKQRVWETIKKYCKRYFIDALSAMALGLFSSLIIGLIISQISQIPGLTFLAEYAAMVKSDPVVGAAIGVATSYGLKSKPLVMFSSAAAGAFGYSVGGPVGSFVAAVVGSEVCRLVSGKTKIDIILSPIVTIVVGCAAGQFVGAPVQALMTGLGNVIMAATTLAPLPMGILVSAIVGMVLTAPISSAALCIMLGLNGLSGGAAVAGCCAQMVGFAVVSFKENGWGGLLSQGIGTSMLQFGNIMRHPAIWLAPTLASAITGPISTCIFQMQCTPQGAGMGTSGLVGQFGTWEAMSATTNPVYLMVQILLVHFILPAIFALLFHLLFKKLGWVKDGDMKLNV